MATTAGSSMDTKLETPPRIKSGFTMELRKSKIPNAGRGLFVMQDVKAGDLIFEVPNVLFASVAQERLTTTCDNCFAHRSTYGTTVPRPDLTFTPCDTCKLVQYCSLTCKESAWAAYHKFECSILARMLTSESGWVGKANPRNEEFRAIIRLLAIHNAGKIPDEEWKEILGLMPQVPGEDKLPHFIEGLPEMLSLIVKYQVTRLDMTTVERLIRAYYNNRCFIQLWTPYELPHYGINRYPFFDTPVGECLEPFYSMINHSCDQNSTWLAKGRTLQVRAERDIAAGEELAICYGWRDTFEERQTHLSGWVGKCTCSLCINPPSEPSGNLREYVVKLITAKGRYATPTQARSISLQFAIREMERRGLGPASWPMRELHTQLFCCRSGQYDGPNILKTWLKVYYAVEPAMRPLECLANRHISLAVLATLFNLKEPSYASLEPYPEQIVKLAPWLHYQLRVRLLNDLRQCHSEDSYCVKFMNAAHERDFGKLEREGEAMGLKAGREYVPYMKSDMSKSLFVKDMNEVLAWADLPARSESQLLTMQCI